MSSQSRHEAVLIRDARPARLPGMLHRALSEAVALIAPPACAACRGPLTRSDALVCAGCLRALAWLRGSRCPRCALPPHRGRRCPAAEAAFDLAWSPLAYEGTAQALVAALKFAGALPVADVMAAQLVATAPPGLLRAGGVLVPVPLHPARRRRRGFDQVYLLTAALVRRTGLPVAACLRRRGSAARQLGAGRHERRASGRLQIEAVGPVPAHALLVDDVHTTGATLDACARTLRAGGARQIVALAYARTL
jgi:predicted amidophosphoribosyltransferase